MKKQFAFTLLFVSFVPCLLTAQDSQSSIADLDWMIGKWSVATEEQDSDGSFFKESGFNHCQYVSKNRMIRCEASLITEEAAGRYKDSWKSREHIIYFSFDKKNDQFIQRLIFPSRTIIHDFKAKSDSVYEGQWLNRGQAIGGDMDMVFQFKVVDNDNYLRIEHLESRDTDFTEHYVMTNRRIF